MEPFFRISLDKQLIPSPENLNKPNEKVKNEENILNENNCIITSGLKSTKLSEEEINNNRKLTSSQVDAKNINYYIEKISEDDSKKKVDSSFVNHKYIEKKIELSRFQNTSSECQKSEDVAKEKKFRSEDCNINSVQEKTEISQDSISPSKYDFNKNKLDYPHERGNNSLASTNMNSIFANINFISSVNNLNILPSYNLTSITNIQTENPFDKAPTHNVEFFKHSIKNIMTNFNINNIQMNSKSLKNLNFLNNPFANNFNNKSSLSNNNLSSNNNFVLYRENYNLQEKNFFNNLSSANLNLTSISNDILSGQFNQNFFKGNFNFYNNYEENVILKNPFEINAKTEKISKFKRNEASQKLYFYEKENAIFINSQLNFQETTVMAHVDNKPSLTLTESRNRLNVLSNTKIFQEDFSKNSEYKFPVIKLNKLTEIYNSSEVNKVEESKEYLNKLKKLNEDISFYEMIEEIDVENEQSFFLGNKEALEEAFISEEEGRENKVKNVTPNKINMSDTKLFENKINIKFQKNKITFIDPKYDVTRKTIPDNAEINELIKAYPELFIACKILDETGKIDYDYHKFIRLVEEEINLDVPIEKKNDEIFKKKIAKKLLSHKFSENQSARRSDAYYGRSAKQYLDEGIFLP